MTVCFDCSDYAILQLTLKFYWSIIKRQRISTTQGCNAYLTPFLYSNKLKKVYIIYFNCKLNNSNGKGTVRLHKRYGFSLSKESYGLVQFIAFSFKV